MNSNLPSTPILHDVLDRLRGAKQHRSGWTAFCPAHDDRKERSLSIGRGSDDRMLVKCFAGCETEDVVKAIGLEMRDLFPKPIDKRSNGAGGASIPSVTDASLQRYAKFKRLPIKFLRSVGLSDFYYGGKPAIRIPYRTLGGQEACVQFRLALEKTDDGDERFRWKSRSKLTLYGLDRLRQSSSVTIVEGASDCHTLWHHGINAVGLPGAGNWNEDRDASHLDGFEKIYVIIEPDKGGEAVKRWLAESSIRDRVRLVDLGEFKDSSDMHIDDPDLFEQRWERALSNSVAWTEIEDAETTEKKREAWELCRTIAHGEAILDLFVAAARLRGVVGETTNLKILYLTLTSRVLPKIVSVAVKGPSGAGKSFIDDHVLAFFPETAYYELTAASERALAYSEEPVKHRIMVYFEAAGLQGDFGSYLMRSLLSEGRIRYETVEKTSEGLRSRLIVRDGPTGLLVTTTQVKLHPENETRLLSLNINDSQEQTAGILDALAQEAEGGRSSDDAVDLVPWLALQSWLELAEHRVVIPYATQLSKSTAPVAVRLRRDFSQLLSLIKSHAILHQATRRRDQEGRIVADIAHDYAVVRDLIISTISEGVGATVRPAIRDTVTTVADIVSAGKPFAAYAELSARLNIDRSSVSRRVRVAIDAGYLRNVQHGKSGRRAEIVPADPLPEDSPLLPTAEELVNRCGVAANTEGIEAPPPPVDDLVEV